VARSTIRCDGFCLKSVCRELPRAVLAAELGRVLRVGQC
jgi:hypothetical protein